MENPNNFTYQKFQTVENMNLVKKVVNVKATIDN